MRDLSFLTYDGNGWSIRVGILRKFFEEYTPYRLMMIDDPSVHTVLLYMYSYLGRGATGTDHQRGARQPRPDAQTHHIISINIAYHPILRC